MPRTCFRSVIAALLLIITGPYHFAIADQLGSTQPPLNISSTATGDIINYELLIIAVVSLFLLLVTLLYHHYKLRKFQNLLIEKEQNMRSFLESTSDCIWNWDMVSDKAERSIGFERAFGYSADEIQPDLNWWSERVHNDDRDRIMQIFDSTIEAGQNTCSFEYRFRCKDGSYATVDDHVSIIRDKKGNPIRALGAMHNITSRKKAETSLAQTYKNLQQIKFALDRIGIGIHMVSLEGNFIYVNEAAASMLGYSQDEMLSMGVPDIDPNYPRENYAEVSSTLRYAAPGRLETTQITRDGQLLPVEVSFYYHSDNDQDDGLFIAFIEDLTDKKAAETEKLRLHEKLANTSKMETIGRLSGGLAHDFNNILSVILGYSELLEVQIDQKQFNKEQSSEYLNNILGSVNRAREIVAQMLLFSRKNPNNSNNKAPTITSWPVIMETTELLRASLPKSVNIYCSADNDTAKVKIQSVHLHQILLNLGVNSRDAIQDSGSISYTQSVKNVQCCCASCFADYSGRYLVISVTDTGTGISKDYVKKVFDPFFSTKGPGEGTGMGLSIVHGLVHSAGGHISIAQTSTKGTTINILLPCLDEEMQVIPDNNLSQSENSKKRILDGIEILLADDEILLAGMLAEALESHGANVSVHVNPLMALKDFQKSPDKYDLLISDMTMPDITGLELSEQILAARPDIPVILCTGYSEGLETAAGKLDGIARILYKPFNLQDFVQTISVVLKRKPHLLVD